MSIISHVGRSSGEVSSIYSGSCALRQCQMFKCNYHVGHYVSDAYSAEDKLWKSFDDSVVTILQEDDVIKLRQTTGYIFFYMHR